MHTEDHLERRDESLRYGNDVWTEDKKIYVRLFVLPYILIHCQFGTLICGNLLASTVFSWADCRVSRCDQLASGVPHLGVILSACILSSYGRRPKHCSRAVWLTTLRGLCGTRNLLDLDWPQDPSKYRRLIIFLKGSLHSRHGLVCLCASSVLNGTTRCSYVNGRPWTAYRTTTDGPRWTTLPTHLR